MSFKPPGGSSSLGSLAGVFNEANPAQITSTPRPAGTMPQHSEKVISAPLAVAYGWIGNDAYQTDGMSVLYVDSVRPAPQPGIRTIVGDMLGRSAYAPYNHYRTGHWLYSRWDPIFRFANTAMDMRFSVGKPPPLSNDSPGNLPFGARMGPYAAPFRSAYQVPRFSTEPFTIIPQAGK